MAKVRRKLTRALKINASAKFTALRSDIKKYLLLARNFREAGENIDDEHVLLEEQRRFTSRTKSLHPDATHVAKAILARYDETCDLDSVTQDDAVSFILELDA